jgi:hypothetical protein
MNKLVKQRLMALFIGFVMLGSMLGFAMIYTRPGGKEVVLPFVINRTLTTEERLSVLRSGRVLIEYFYNRSCLACEEKVEMYKKFVNLDQFKGYAVLSYSPLEANQSEEIDIMFNLDGTQIELKDVKTLDELKKKFCEVAIIKPNVCVLEEL